MPASRSLLALLALALPSLAAPPVITTRTDAVGTQLNAWAASFQAAGLAALQYENRDGQHSPLPAVRYPQLGVYQATAEEKQLKADTGFARVLRAKPTLGNCSMAAPANAGGSIPRMFFLQQPLQGLLFQQYLHNNLIIYPEHQDYDPGANGQGGGYGDLLPANSCTLLISQGSSFSDQPFLDAMLATTAAFQPSIQRLLIEKRILIPTLQAILRQSLKGIDKPEDYLSGRAHPPVFAASQLDELKMITSAQLMGKLAIPPLAFVEVVSERRSTPGIDFFELPHFKDEVLGTTPANVARVFRSSAEVYDMQLNAHRSIDLDKRTLTYRWVILQGDPQRISIATEDEGRRANLRVRWHNPMPASNGIRSHRADIGLFVSNGIAWSAPAFITFYFLPNERRFFDSAGRLTEVCYTAGNPELGLPTSATDEQWLGFFEQIASEAKSLPQQLLHQHLSSTRSQAIASLWPELRHSREERDSSRQAASVKGATPALKAKASAAQAALDAAIRAAVSQRFEGQTLSAIASQIVTELAADPQFYLSRQTSIRDLAKASPKPTAEHDLLTERQRLIGWCVLENNEATGQVVCTHAADALTEADRWYLRCLNLTALSQAVFPTWLSRSPAPLYSDPALTAPKAWRDVYRYDDKGQRTGWLRFQQNRMTAFTADGKAPPDKPVRYDLINGRLEAIVSGEQ